jgi:putative aldouronate transport system substrate-binding protein
MIKRISLAAAVALLATQLVMAGGARQSGGNTAVAPSTNFNPTGYPIVKEKITLTGFGNQNVTHKNWNEIYCFTEYEKKSNIHIEWILAPNQGFQERKNTLLASGDYPDFFYRCNLTAADQINYGSRGALIALNGLIDQYGPNLKERFKELPDMYNSVKMPDGNIYSLPTKSVVIQNSLNNNWINGRWLKNLGLEVPKTLDELEAVLTAFKTRDANGNGDPNDEIPYSDRVNGVSIFTATASAFGIGSLGNVSAQNNFVDLGDDGKVRLFAVTDDYRQQLQWIAGLYAKGLLDPEMFTQDIAAFTAKGEQDLIGAFFINGSPEIIGAKNMDAFVAASAFVGRSGKAAVFNNMSPIYGLGAFAISKQNKYPAETMRWIDYYYGDEGALLLWLGEEGVTYVKLPGGGYTVTDLIRKNPNGLNMPQAMGQYAIGFAGGGCPVYATNEMERARVWPIVFTTYDMIKPMINVKALPILSFTMAEQDELNPLISDIITYIRESRVQFITGRLPLSQWDNYVKRINDMGGARYTVLLQTAYDRWARK